MGINDVQTQITTQITANNAGKITAGVLSSVLLAMLALLPSYATISSPALTGAPTINGIPVITGVARGMNVIDDFGAKGDCATDDGPAFNTAISTLVATSQHGGQLRVPAPSGGCYLVKTMILLPSNGTTFDNSVEFIGDGWSTVVRAGAAMDAVFQKDANWNNGYAFKDFTIDANALALHAIDILGGAKVNASRMQFINAAGTSNVKIAGQDHYFINSYFWNNPNVIAAVNLPSYNIEVTASDNYFIANDFVNAKTCNSYDAGPDNHFISNHAWGTPSPAYTAQNDFCISSFGIYEGNTADGAVNAGYLVTGYGAHLTGNRTQYAVKGIEIASGLQNLQIIGNNSDEGNVTGGAVVYDGAPGANSCVAFNGGAQPVMSSCGPLAFGYTPNATSSGTLGYVGTYSRMGGSDTFGLGGNISDEYRIGGFYRANGSFSWLGDAQIYDVILRGSGTSGTVNILSNGSGSAYTTNEIPIRQDIAAKYHVAAKLDAFCSTLDYGTWAVDFSLVANKSAASVKFEGASALTTTPPTWTAVRQSTGAASWTPAIVLDTTNGGAYFTGTGTCTGSKTIYWVADVHVVEIGAGAN